MRSLRIMAMLIPIMASLITDVEGYVQQVSRLFIFGDSYVDSGTNNYINSSFRADFYPYGRVFFHHPTGRFTDGRHFGDFIAQYLKLPFPKPYLQPGMNPLIGANFASGGAGILDYTNQNLPVVNLSTQVQQFLSLRSKESIQSFIDAFYLISIGANDIIFTYLRNSTLMAEMSSTQFTQMLVNILSKDITVIYKAGARKIVLLELQPLGCAPGQVVYYNLSVGQCHEPTNELAEDFNFYAEQMVYRLNSNYPDMQLLLARIYKRSLKLIFKGYPQGFVQGQNACCGTGPLNGATQCGTTPSTNICVVDAQYFFFDFYHPTEHAYQVLTEGFINGDKRLIIPTNIASLTLRKVEKYT